MMRRIPDGIPAASTKDRYKEGTLKNRMPSFVVICNIESNFIVVSNVEDSVGAVARAAAARETPDTRPGHLFFVSPPPEGGEAKLEKKPGPAFHDPEAREMIFSSHISLYQPACSRSFSQVLRLAE